MHDNLHHNIESEYFPPSAYIQQYHRLDDNLLSFGWVEKIQSEMNDP